MKKILAFEFSNIITYIDIFIYISLYDLNITIFYLQTLALS